MRTGFKMEFVNVESQTIEVLIINTLSGVDDGTFDLTDIEGAEDACHIFVVDNEENKFSPIRAKQAEIRILSTATINLNTFIGSEDNQWYTEIRRNGEPLFKGFLVLEDSDEDFLDSASSNEITLIATDNIGLLKDEPLTDWQGNNPRGFYTLLTYICFALRKTGLTLPINVVHNIKEVNFPTQQMIDWCAVDAKTFEADVNESIDCYSAIEAILSHGAFLTQSGGEWWIVRIDDLQDGSTYQYVYDVNGRFVERKDIDITQTFGTGQDILFSDMSTFVKVQAAANSIKLTYNFDYPREIVNNIDFSQGRLINDLGNIKEYELLGWTLRYFTIGTQLPEVTTQGKAFIRRVFQDGYEKERYAVIQHPSAPNTRGFHLSSDRIPVRQGDKFDVSVDSRYNADVPGSGFYRHQTMLVRLYAEGGIVYVLHPGNSADPVPRWVTSILDYFWTEGYYQNDDTRDWKSLYRSTESNQNGLPPCPANGELEIMLVYSMTTGSERHFANLSFTYNPLINGSYQKYRGQYNKVAQNINTKKTVDETVKISDSPRSLFKGALHYPYSLPTIYIGPGTFTAPNQLQIPGNVTKSFRPGKRILIYGIIANQNGHFILSASFASGTTTILLDKPVVSGSATLTVIAPGDYRLAGPFYDGRGYLTTPPTDPNLLKPFGQLQAFDVSNQNNRPFRLFDFNAQGLNGSAVFPDIIHKYTIDETTPHTSNKWFMMLHYDQDLKLCEWKGVMAEVYDTTIPKQSSPAVPVDFKYISE